MMKLYAPFIKEATLRVTMTLRNQYVSTVNYVILGHIPTICMANAVYRRIFDDVFVMTSAEKSIRRDVFT